MVHAIVGLRDGFSAGRAWLRITAPRPRHEEKPSDHRIEPSHLRRQAIVRNRRLAIEHVLGMLAAGDTPEIVLQGYPLAEPDDIRACLLYARCVVGHERIEPALVESSNS